MSIREHSIISMLGGVDKMGGESNTIEVIGGFDKDLNLSYKNIVTGDITKTFLKNKITEWESFKEVYYEKGKLDKKYYDKFIAMLNDIFILPFYCDDEKELLHMICNIYSASNSQIYVAMSNTLNLINSVKLIIKHLFMSYKVFIEKLIEIYVILRNNHITKNNIQKQNKYNDFKPLINKWIDIDMENNINTSSVILFFNFPSKKVKLEKSIEKIEWYIKGASKDITTATDKFMSEIKSNDFYYCGFCPFIPIERFKILSRFPVSALIKLIKLLNNSTTELKILEHPIAGRFKETTGSFKTMSVKATVTIDINIINQIEQNINNLKLLNKDIVKINNIHINKLSKHKITKHKPTNKNDYIAVFEKYICAYLDLYKQVAPTFIKKEKLINDLLTKVNTISKSISELTNKIILKE